MPPQAGGVGGEDKIKNIKVKKKRKKRGGGGIVGALKIKKLIGE